MKTKIFIFAIATVLIVFLAQHVFSTKAEEKNETAQSTETKIAKHEDKQDDTSITNTNPTDENLPKSEQLDTKNEDKVLESQVVETTENKSKGKLIYVDAGHQAQGDNTLELIYPGGSEKKARNTSGTHGVATGKNEYQLNLEVALKLQSKLESNGYTVMMSRTQNDVNTSNIDRAKQANENHADAAIRIHADGNDSSSVNGFSVLVPSGTHISNQNVVVKSNDLGNCILSAMQNNLDANSRGVIARDDLTGFNWSEVPVVLVEMGFMTNPEEDIKMSTEDYQNKIVQSLSDGIDNYFNMQ